MTADLWHRRPTSPLDIDDLLFEILLRLPPQPSSIPRASPVCSRWRHLISDRDFLCRFRLHHRRSPPLLGCFVRTFKEFYFEPTMEPPNRVPRGLFSLQTLRGDIFRHFGCRHGLVVIYNHSQHQVLVWDPNNGAQHRLALAPGFYIVKAQGHIQGRFFALPRCQHFQVILVGVENKRVIVRIYSSETGGWGDQISTPLLPMPYMHGVLYMDKPSVLVGDSLYWLIAGDFVGITEFDLERQSVAVTVVPTDMQDGIDYQGFVMRADDGGLGFLFLSDFSAQLWKRKTNCDGTSSWVLGRTIELDKLISMDLHKDKVALVIIGFAEENNVVFLFTALGIFMIQLDSLQAKKMLETDDFCTYYPFESVYTADRRIGGGRDGAELLPSA